MPAAADRNVQLPYQVADSELINYEAWQLENTSLAFRGPREAADAYGRRIAFIGAAQTMGRFVSLPFPSIVGAALSYGVLNLGYAGAGPSFFTGKPKVLELANASAAVVVQVMSGRSVSNALVEAVGGRNIYRWHADQSRLKEGEVFQRILALPQHERETVIAETRNNWVMETSALLHALMVPKVLLWFSSRTPFYVEGAASGRDLLGGFPHLVNDAMIEMVRPLADAYVECVTSRGVPHHLLNPATGAPVSIRFSDARSTSVNAYYPSPTMHLDVAGALVDPLAELLGTRHSHAVAGTDPT